MSIATVMQRVCRQVGVKEIPSITTSSDRTAQELLTHYIEAGEEITRRAEWPNLLRTQALSGSIGSIPLPTDFQRLAKGQPLSLSDGSPIYPVRSSQAWAVMSAAPSTTPHFYIHNGVLWFLPFLPADGATLTYLSVNWINNGSAATYTTDTDTADIPESLLSLGIVWRYRRAKGLNFQDMADEFEAEIDRELNAARGFMA